MNMSQQKRKYDCKSLTKIKFPGLLALPQSSFVLPTAQELPWPRLGVVVPFLWLVSIFIDDAQVVEANPVHQAISLDEWVLAQKVFQIFLPDLALIASVTTTILVDWLKTVWAIFRAARWSSILRPKRWTIREASIVVNFGATDSLVATIQVVWSGYIWSTQRLVRVVVLGKIRLTRFLDWSNLAESQILVV